MQAYVLPKGVMFSILILTILLMTSGVVLLFYTTVSHPAELRSQATATVRSLQTASTNSTVTAQAQTTTIAQGQARAVATSLAQATIQAQATTTAQQAIYTQATSGTPLLTSTLAEQGTANWDTYSAQEGGGCSFSDGAFHAAILGKGFYLSCFAQGKALADLTNFALEVQLNPIQGDAGGVIFRANDQTHTSYMFRLTHDGYFSLDARTDPSHGTALAYEKNPLVSFAPGKKLTLTIIAQGSNIYLYINKQLVGSVNDTTYSTGKIGFFASDTTNPTEMAFSNLRVWKL
ncbi:family 16 glycoside hydrolase [Tengunoibacter tsumagoiensis]|uniref:3-keto-alpha-glucoside-1,2-lyase/3-keto-2-hydroxy-glucal hydratase domain-containing protein n=1 Tax=Tengunoibacter tsumagoiensis TaxID=2014871 RepID=A0A402A4E3_9CHLR|nr:family 16 glycoside hydrolase [Tengunoibacter tsumagoiensis]GCE13939.1 hypothetical protein KTT_37980 [Tengunoibacter tsumagoiensis]